MENVQTKRKSRFANTIIPTWGLKKGGVTLFALLLVGGSILFAVGGQMTLKQGMNQVGEIQSFTELFSPHNIAKLFSNGFVLAGLFFYAFSAIFWLGALSKLDVSYAYPLFSITYLIVAVLAFLLLKENVTLVRWAGIILIILGAFLLTRS